MELRNVVIVDGVRSPFARASRGKLVATRLDEVGATVIRAIEYSAIASKESLTTMDRQRIGASLPVPLRVAETENGPGLILVA